MEYPKHLFKSPGPFGSGDRSYAVVGAGSEAEEAALIDLGWHPSKENALLEAPSVAPVDMVALRAEYQGLAGKRAFPGWAEDVLREKIAALTKGA